MHFYVGIDARLKAYTLNHSHDVDVGSFRWKLKTVKV